MHVLKGVVFLERKTWLPCVWLLMLVAESLTGFGLGRWDFQDGFCSSNTVKKQKSPESLIPRVCVCFALEHH